MRAASFSAWCRRDGVHETGAQSYMDWNDDLLKAVTKSFGELWPCLQQAFTERKVIFSADLHKLLEGIRDDLHGRSRILL